MKRAVRVLITSCLCFIAASAFAAGPVKITFLSHTYEPWNNKLKEQAAAFMAKNPGVTIEYSTVMHEDLYTKLMSSLQAGTAADVIGVYGPWMTKLVNAGALAEAPTDVQKDVRANLTPFGIDAVTFNNKIYGYIQHIGILAPIVNPDFFAKLGEKVPDTWSGYAALADKYAAQSKKDVAITALAPSSVHLVIHWSTILRSLGGKVLSDDLKQAAFNSPEGLKATEMYVKLSDPNFPENDANSVFILGKAGMVLDGPWAKTFYTQSTAIKNFSTTIPPKEKTRAIGAYVWDWAVSARSSKEKQRVAWDFVKFISNDANYLDMAKTIGFAPFRKGNIAEMSKDKWVKGFTDSLQYAFVYYPRIENWEEIERLIGRELERAVAKEISPQEALSNAETAVNQALGG